MDITRLIRPEVASLQAYVPILPFEVLSARLGRAPGQIVKLDANENPYGPSPRVLAALGALPFPHIYPDPKLPRCGRRWRRIPACRPKTYWRARARTS